MGTFFRAVVAVASATFLTLTALPPATANPSGELTNNGGSVAEAFANRQVSTTIVWNTGGSRGTPQTPPVYEPPVRNCVPNWSPCVRENETWTATGVQRWDANPAEREHQGSPSDAFGRSPTGVPRSANGPGRGTSPFQLTSGPINQNHAQFGDFFTNAAGVGIAVRCSTNVATTQNPVTGQTINFYPYGYAWSVRYTRGPAERLTAPGDLLFDTDPETGEQTPRDDNGDGIQDRGPDRTTGYNAGAVEGVVTSVECLYPADPVWETQTCALRYKAPGDKYPNRAATVSGPFGAGLPARNLAVTSAGRLSVEQIASTVARTTPSSTPAGTTDFHDDVYQPGGRLITPGDGSTARAWANEMVECSKIGFADLNFTLAAPGNYRVDAVADVISCGWYRFGEGWYAAGVESVVWVGCNENQSIDLREWMWKGCTGVITGKTSPALAPPVAGTSPQATADATALGIPAPETTRGESNDWNPARCANARCTWNADGGFDPGQLKVTVIGQNPSRTGVKEVVLDADVTREPDDLTDALSDKMWLAKADGATAYRFTHFLRDVRIDTSRGDADFIGTVWQTTDSATPWRLSPFSRDRLGVLDERQPFKVTTAGAAGSKVSPLVVTEYDKRGDDAELTLGRLPAGMSTNPDHLTDGRNDLLMRFYAPGNVGGLGDRYSDGKVTGFPIRAIGVWDVTYDDYSTDLGAFGAPGGVVDDTEKVGTASVAKICHTQWTTALPIAAGR